MPSILSNLRRSRERSRKTSSLTSPSKAKPLDILPGVTEISEQEENEQLSSAPSSVIHLSHRPKPQTHLSLQIPQADLLAKKRDSRRVVLTGVEGLTFDDLFPLQAPRPAPSPPNVRPTTAAPAHVESPLETISLRFSSLKLPFTRAPTTPESVRSPRSSSPTPSCASNTSVSTVSSAASTSSTRAKVLTPPTSDDECHESLASRLARAPTVKSHRGTIGYVPGAPKQRSASEKSFVDLGLDEDELDDEPEDASWFARDISDSFVLSSPENEPCTLAKTPVASIPRVSGKSRFSKPLPAAPRMSVQSINNACPSAQLDPAFPTKRRSYIPNRPPPPPPIRIVDIDCGTNIFIAPPTPEEPSKGSPTMEEKTEELLTLLANAALTTTSLAAPSGPSRLSCISNLVVPTTVTPHSCDFIVPTPTVIRPLPRFVPADISELSDPEAGSPASADFFVADSDELDLGALELEWMPDSDDDESLPSTPRSTDSRSLYSQASMSRVAALNELSLDAIPLEPATPAGSFLFIGNDDDEFLGMAIPDSPSVRPHDDMFFPVQSEKVLRSRWSSSTLAESFADHRSSGWRGRFIFGASKKPQSPTKTGFILKSPTMPSFNISKPTFATPTKKGTPSAPSPAVSASPTKRSGAPNTPRSSPAKSSRGSPVRTLARRDSNASLCSSDSGESVCSASSSTSNGLRRKPIPIEIFMRA